MSITYRAIQDVITNIVDNCMRYTCVKYLNHDVECCYNVEWQQNMHGEHVRRDGIKDQLKIVRECRKRELCKTHILWRLLDEVRCGCNSAVNVSSSEVQRSLRKRRWLNQPPTTVSGVDVITIDWLGVIINVRPLYTMYAHIKTSSTQLSNFYQFCDYLPATESAGQTAWNSLPSSL